MALMMEINQNSIKRVDGEWKHFKDNGEEFIEENHSYAGDLDIFGRSSLFQWINAASTYLGRIRLKNMLSSPCRDKGEIYKKSI